MRPFSRFIALMATMAAAIQAEPTMGRAQALELAGGYRSRGKGRAVSPFSQSNGSVKVRREACKTHNRAAHRAACRGAA